MNQFIIEKRHTVLGGGHFYYGPFPKSRLRELKKKCDEYGSEHNHAWFFFFHPVSDSEDKLLSQEFGRTVLL